MKKIVSILFVLFFGINVLAQQAKKCLFIGIYEKNKRGICGDYEFVHEEIADYADFAIMRTKFYEAHKTNSKTVFVDADEAIIIYAYEKKISGWNCNSNVISYKTAKSIEDCNKLLADQLAKNPSDFTTRPETVFTWQGKNKNTTEYTKDFGGLKGKFTAVNTATKSLILTQLTNTAKDKIAYVLVKADNKESVEYINPGATLTKKFDAKNMEISVIYLDSNKPKPAFNAIDFVKSKVRETITNENGKIKGSSPGSIGVRG
nr:hypothetical protein [uncultured Flavobacterium sp.]